MEAWWRRADKVFLLIEKVQDFLHLSTRPPLVPPPSLSFVLKVQRQTHCTRGDKSNGANPFQRMCKVWPIYSISTPKMSREKWEEHAENEHKCLQDEDLTAIFFYKKKVLHILM